MAAMSGRCFSQQLDPITAMCFKVKADAEVCDCATLQLAIDSSEEDFEIYESIVARTLSQTNVPRNRAWNDALKAEADHRQMTLQAITDLSTETGTTHNLALQDCVEVADKY